jgi:hypothetical protein
MLSIESEGKQVAKWLTGRGIAAFILNYRLNETPAATADFEKAWTSLFQPRSDRDTISSILGTAGAKLAMSDGLEAIKRVRRRASEWGVSTDRIGFLGFSAGGIGDAWPLPMIRTADQILSAASTVPFLRVSARGCATLFLAVAADDPLRLDPHAG